MMNASTTCTFRTQKLGNAINQRNLETASETFDQNVSGKDIFDSIDVPENLSRYVKRISMANCTEPVSFSSAVPPTGAAFLDLMFRGGIAHTKGSLFQRRTRGELIIAGQVRNENIEIEYSGLVGHIVFHFAPLGLYELLGVTGQSTAGQISKVANISQRARPLALELSEMVANESTTDVAQLSLATITRHLSDFARRPLSVPNYLHQTVAIAERCQGAVRVSEIAQEVGVSERQLSREFSRLVGLPPKFYCRVLQINTALENMLHGNGEKMIDVALQRDFTDQAHFNRVFRQFLKMNPREYLDSDELMLSHFLANWQGPHRN